MTELIQKAIDKIDAEAEKSKNGLEKSIAQYIIDNCLKSEVNANAVLDKNNTLKNCALAVTADARKQAHNGSCCIVDAVVYKWVREYYGISEATKADNIAAIHDDNVVNLLDLL